MTAKIFEFERGGEPLRRSNPGKENRRKTFGNSGVLDRRRFLLPQNREARELLKRFAKAVEEIKMEYPEVVTFSMHGSMVKGYADKKSDIDGYLYIDVTRGNNIEAQRDPNPYVRATALQNLITEQLIGKLSVIDGTKARDIVALPIDKETLVKRAHARDILDLYPLFLLSIGGDIDEYRKVVLDTLESMGETGEFTWKLVVDELWEHENVGFDKQVAEKRRELYPKTIAEARKYFLRRSPAERKTDVIEKVGEEV